MSRRREREVEAQVGREAEPEWDPKLTVIVAPGGGGRTRTFRISYRHLRGALPLAALACMSMVFSWGYLAWQEIETRLLEAEVVRLAAQEATVAELAGTLAEVEAAYDGILELFGASTPPDAGDLWLPPVSGLGAPGGGPEDGDLPTAWPLTQRGFVTQPLLVGAGADHPGIDVAVVAGSYVRAAGNGTVMETGEDEVYGNYIVVDHGGGYQTRYAHASAILASERDPVSRNEVIALSGTSGQSTAPHLHFEILREGGPIDPFSLVTQP